MTTLESVMVDVVKCEKINIDEFKLQVIKFFQADFHFLLGHMKTKLPIFLNSTKNCFDLTQDYFR